MLPNHPRQRNSMRARGTLLGGLALLMLATVIGCNAKRAPVPVEEAYPVRSDWLVKTTPSGVQPSKWYEPGYPPLLMLNRPFSTLTGDDALLVSQINRTI